jgi:hypothetical protein
MLWRLAEPTWICDLYLVDKRAGCLYLDHIDPQLANLPSTHSLAHVRTGGQRRPGSLVDARGGGTIIKYLRATLRMRPRTTVVTVRNHATPQTKIYFKEKVTLKCVSAKRGRVGRPARGGAAGCCRNQSPGIGTLSYGPFLFSRGPITRQGPGHQGPPRGRVRRGCHTVPPFT